MKREVRVIDYPTVREWCLKAHYAARTPSISLAFGLFIDNELRGICSYGTPASSALLNGVCGTKWAKHVIELNRLVIIRNEPNLASYFVAQTLKLIPRPKIIVSYADTAVGHTGIIYQACNFLYTGLSAIRTDWKLKGQEHLHGVTVADLSRGKENRADWMRKTYGDDFYLEPRARKHRYIMFLGSKVQRKRLLKALNYPLQPYPKGEKRVTGNPHYQPAEAQLALI